MNIKKVTSLADLRSKARADPIYAKLAIVAAANLGASEDVHRADPLGGALRWLGMNADETHEAGVVAEVNAVRDVVSDALDREVKNAMHDAYHECGPDLGWVDKVPSNAEFADVVRDLVASRQVLGAAAAAWFAAMSRSKKRKLALAVGP